MNKSLHKSAPKRSTIEIEQDREAFSERSLKGWTIRQIAEWVGENRKYTLSIKTVCTDIQAVRKKWLEDSKDNMGELMAKKMATLELMEAEAWAGYKRSLRGVSKIKNSNADGGSDEAVQYLKDGEFDKKGKQEYEPGERDGDPKWLDTILKIIERQCKLKGLDAPEKVQVSKGSSFSEVQIDGFSMEARKEYLAAIKEKEAQEKAIDIPS